MEEEDFDVLEYRRRKAHKIGVVTGLTVFAVVLFGTPLLITLGFGAPLDGVNDRQRGEFLAEGALRLAFWSGLLAWGIARLLVRAKADSHHSS